MTKPAQQRGVALIIVLLILSIATVALVSMSSSRQLDIRRTENLLRSAQAYEYLYSLESWAAKILRDERRENNQDSLNDSWAEPLAKTAVPGGTMDARITDLQGRFNVNNLLVEDQPSALDVQRFRRLLALLKIKPGITDAILDWLDTDSAIRYPDGAEDETYAQQQTPYRCANRPFADLGELLSVYGITPEDYHKLAPYLYVAEGYQPMNINTAEPLLIRSLADQLSAKNTERLARAIKRQAFGDLEAFLQHDLVAAQGIDKLGLTVSSRHFLLSGTIQVGKIFLRFDSQLKRLENGNIQVLKRQRRSPEHG
ncbi:MAG: type II secretion system minor pseudopilin GspK [Methylovulum sp.]|nr:type II secretion system minor pseudopilin GspK [Methylovulum sp.]